MLDSSVTNKSGIVTKIHTRIRTDAYKTNYDLVGKVLGRNEILCQCRCININCLFFFNCDDGVWGWGVPQWAIELTSIVAKPSDHRQHRLSQKVYSVKKKNHKWRHLGQHASHVDDEALTGSSLRYTKCHSAFKLVEKATGNEYAAKFLRKRRNGQDCRADILNEIAVLEAAKANPYVVGLHEVYETSSEIILVLEYAAGGEIFNQCVADNDEAFTEKDVIRLARQILTGVAYLHRNNVVHLDLKPQNILLTSAQPLGDIRIVDFGLSRHVDNKSEVREILGTPEYMAPETLSYEPVTTATDMWSIGVLTYVMLTGVSPFLGDENQETYLNISQCDVDYSQDIFHGISSLAVDFIQSLLHLEPRNRSTAEECLHHPWLNTDTAATTTLSPTVATVLDEQETSQSESEPESPDLSPELPDMPSYTTCPVQGDLKTGRGTFTFTKSFPTRPEMQQELIC
ncbi:Serine/threonine-protein kinase 17A [Bagarius yarrelli]|uniref:non-specific serine/threonine protein kinase n=1 Tax=Bagarius yarrelli TaxID=175774 RepID=A0A556VCK7_BAGYA|nr:Serine/threonine-protein kinase 17A [Bagarius yarrelli]